MSWTIFAFLAPLMFVIYQGISKLLPKDVSIFLVNAYASLAGFIIMLLLYFLTSSDKSVLLTSKNVLIAFLIGTFVVFGNFFIIKAYSLGAPQSSFSAIMYPLLIVYAALVGVFVWHEKINIWQFVGILLSVVGIILVLYFKENASLIN